MNGLDEIVRIPREEVRRYALHGLFRVPLREYLHIDSEESILVVDCSNLPEPKRTVLTAWEKKSTLKVGDGRQRPRGAGAIIRSELDKILLSNYWLRGKARDAMYQALQQLFPEQSHPALTRLHERVEWLDSRLALLPTYKNDKGE